MLDDEAYKSYLGMLREQEVPLRDRAALLEESMAGSVNRESSEPDKAATVLSTLLGIP